MPYVYKEVEVEIDMEDFDDDEIIEEYERRHLQSSESNGFTSLYERMYEKYRTNKPIDEELRELFYEKLGRLV